LVLGVRFLNEMGEFLRMFLVDLAWQCMPECIVLI
jgi:hypothetical protein